MRTYLWVALGCLFWLLPLAGAARRVSEYGFYEQGYGFAFDSVPLLGIPIAMIVLTAAVGWQAKNRKLGWPIIAASSAVAVIASFYWLAIWGRGV